MILCSSVFCQPAAGGRRKKRESDSRPKQERATPNECAIDEKKKHTLNFTSVRRERETEREKDRLLFFTTFDWSL